jgi:hypothetical protein
MPRASFPASPAASPAALQCSVITRGIREFVSRDWRAARESKDAYWGERIGRLGPLEGLRVADELRRQALLRDPAWPDAALRRADLSSHARLAELLRRAGSARRP